jgi:hypothetical protein
MPKPCSIPTDNTIRAPSDPINEKLTSPTKQSILSPSCIMDCFASLAMTVEYSFAFSRRDAPEVLEIICPFK